MSISDEMTNAQKLDILIERTEGLDVLAETVEEHDCILRGPNKDDGLITDMAKIKDFVDSARKLIWLFLGALIVETVGLAFVLIRYVIAV
jgi:hypothetical protein